MKEMKKFQWKKPGKHWVSWISVTSIKGIPAHYHYSTDDLNLNEIFVPNFQSTYNGNFGNNAIMHTHVGYVTVGHGHSVAIGKMIIPSNTEL
jgi:hypothetical protein